MQQCGIEFTYIQIHIAERVALACVQNPRCRYVWVVSLIKREPVSVLFRGVESTPPMDERDLSGVTRLYGHYTERDRERESEWK